MERDDEQLLRHSTREVGSYLCILRDELRGCGLSDSVVEQIVISQYHQLQSIGMAAEMNTMLEKFATSLQGFEEEDE